MGKIGGAVKNFFSRLYKKFLNNLAGISYNLQKKFVGQGQLLDNQMLKNYKYILCFTLKSDYLYACQPDISSAGKCRNLGGNRLQVIHFDGERALRG